MLGVCAGCLCGCALLDRVCWVCVDVRCWAVCECVYRVYVWVCAVGLCLRVCVGVENVQNVNIPHS